MVTTVKHIELKEVLMEPKAEGVKEPYFLIRGEAGQNITVVTSGKNGEEFNKTYGYFHRQGEIIIYHVLYGQGVMVLQRNDEEGEAKEFKVVALRPGVNVEVPAGSGHCLVNTGKNYLVTVDNSSEASKPQECEPVKEKKGFAYYVVDKKGDVGFSSNPHYTIHPQISLY